MRNNCVDTSVNTTESCLQEYVFIALACLSLDVSNIPRFSHSTGSPTARLKSPRSSSSAVRLRTLNYTCATYWLPRFVRLIQSRQHISLGFTGRLIAGVRINHHVKFSLDSV